MSEEEPDFEALKGAVGAVRQLITHLRKTKADPALLADVEREAKALSARLAPTTIKAPMPSVAS